MSEIERLQKAVEATVSAGYQLSKEAFEFLSVIAATEDPTVIMNNALQRVTGLEERPLFIDRHFLEKVVKETEQAIESQPESHDEIGQGPPELTVIESKGGFRPHAEEIESRISIIEDPTAKLSSNGTIEDYLTYFRDRFRRIERLLRQRIDVKAATSLTEALKSPPRTKLKIICMITEKREAKKRIILSVEDLQANATVLVPQNASEDLHRKAEMVLQDQVVCLEVTKTRGSLFIAEDIIFPEIGQRSQRKSPELVYAVLTSDMHVGSAKFQREAFNRFILWLNGKYGNERMKEIASNVKYVLIAGDIVDGIGIYPNQIKELAVRDVHKQYRLAARFIEQIPDYIEVIVIPGNHDVPRKALPQPAISEDFLETLREARNVHSLGNPCIISLHDVEVLMYHGRSLDDVISTVPGMDYTHPEKAMKLLLQSRHLAPLYGGKTMVSPENRDFLVVEHVPDIFHAGHIHVLGYCSYRGVLTVNSGGWQEQTGYMQRLGLVPTPGKVPVVNLQTLEVTILPFN